MTQPSALFEKIMRYRRKALDELKDDGGLSLRTRQKMEVAVPHLVSALEALQNGTYGTCRDCSEPIPEKRLATVPGATRCTSCQSDFDRSRK